MTSGMAKSPWVRVARLRAAIAADPGDPTLQLDLMANLVTLGRLDEAADWAARATLDAPEGDRPMALARALQTLCRSGRRDVLAAVGDALSCLEAAPLDWAMGSFLPALTLAWDIETTKRLMTLHRVWGMAFARTFGQAVPAFTPPRNTGKLRIGILSGDFRTGSVTKFLMPLLEGYDRDRFEIHGYGTLEATTDATERHAIALIDRFQRVAGRAPPDLIALLRADRLDIILEMNGMTLGTRLPALACRAAPIQIAWLGYPFTTGIPAIDYLMLDEHLRPAGEGLIHETVLTLPGAWACYGMMSDADPAPHPPSRDNGAITFGSLNNPYKYSADTVELWASVLNQVPDSRFLVGRPEAGDSFMENLTLAFAARGIARERVAFARTGPPGPRFEDVYNRIDISLDTWPLTGGTTTVDSLDMGVPVISRVGPALHQRISHAVLQHVGVPELSQDSAGAYVSAAASLAANPERLAAYRRRLRADLRASPLCDKAGFVASFQQAMRTLAHRHGLRDA